VLSLFREGVPSIRSLGWKAHLLLWLWIAFPLFTIFIPRAAGVGVVILGVSVLIGVVIGVTEELL
jgi:hypothetical protein